MRTEPVLVLRALGLGDLLAGVAALRGLRRCFPGRDLVLAAAHPVAAFLCDLGVVDAVVPTRGLGDTPPGLVLGPHVAVNLHGRGPQSHDLLRRAEPSELVAFARVDCGIAGPPWRADEHEVSRWCRLVRWRGGWCERRDVLLPHDHLRLDGFRPVVVHPGASAAARRWPTSRWAAVAAALHRDGNDVVVTGGPGESGLVEAVVAEAGLGDETARDGLDLGALARLVAGARVVLSGDTGVAHLAFALAAPSVTVYGPVSPRAWGPAVDPGLHAVVRADGPDGEPNADALDERLARVTVDDVLRTARDMLAAGTRRGA